MLDYLPSVIAFASAIIGLGGKSWEPEKKGWERLTIRGRLVIVLASISLLGAISAIKSNHARLATQQAARELAYADIMRGLQAIVYPILPRHMSDMSESSNDRIFDEIMKAESIDRLGRVRVVSGAKLGGTFFTACGRFEGDTDHYLVQQRCVEKGELHIRSSVAMFAGVLDAEAISLLGELITDRFFLFRYRLWEKAIYFDAGKLDEASNPRRNSPWLTVGLYYFNAVYEGEAKRPGDEREFRTFVNRIRKLVDHLNKNRLKEESIVVRS